MTQRRNHGEEWTNWLTSHMMQWWNCARQKASKLWLTKRPKPFNYRDHEKYLEATKLKEKFEPVDDGKYAWVMTYAKESYDRLEKSFQYLDDKADSIIKYLGGGTAVIALAALTTVTKSNAWLPYLLLPSFFLALYAIALAVKARTPQVRPSPPVVSTALEYECAYTDKAEATFIVLASGL